MAAYGALVSLMQIIHQIEHHPFPPISLDKQQAESLTEIVTTLQEFLEGYSSPFGYSDKADPLEMRIADAAYAAEDVIEAHIVDRILPTGSEDQRNRIGFFNCFRNLKEPKNDGEKINSVDLCEGLQKVIQDMDLIKKEAMEIVAEKAVVQDQLQREVSAASLKSSSTAMVGFEDVINELKDKLNGSIVKSSQLLGWAGSVRPLLPEIFIHSHLLRIVLIFVLGLRFLNNITQKRLFVNFFLKPVKKATKD